MQVLNNPRVANATALLSPVIALSSTAYAANTVRSADIVNGQVKKKDLANNAVSGPKVKDGSLTTADLAAGTAPRNAAYATSRVDEYTVPNGPGFHTVLTLDIPQAGAYVVLGKLEVNSNEVAPVRPRCRVLTGGRSDSGRVGLGAGADDDDVQTVTYVVAATVAAAGTAVLQCEKAAPTHSLEVTDRNLVAIKVDSLASTEAVGP